MYEIEVRDEAGRLVVARRTAAASPVLVRDLGVHSTDSWDWVRAADEQFERGSSDWVVDPFRT
jgi:hypothetical protein